MERFALKTIKQSLFAFIIFSYYASVGYGNQLSHSQFCDTEINCLQLIRMGDVNAHYQYAMMFLEGNSINKSRSDAKFWLKKSVELGHPDAPFELAVLLLDESALDSNKKIIVDLLTQSAKNNHSEACFILGNIYSDGKITYQDDKQAFYWYEKAAYLGEALAQIKVAEFYENGKGIRLDLAKAYAWYQLAKSSSIDEITHPNIDKLYRKLSKSQREKANKIISFYGKKFSTRLS